MDYVIIENVLSPELMQRVTHAIKAGPFLDGKATANGLAKAMKNNLQLSSEIHNDLLDEIGQSIMANPIVQVYAMPSNVTRPIINRYEAGMEYGMHIDQAYVGNVRTDLSFTLFLNDPDSYKGGELVIAGQPQQKAFKLPAGNMIIYLTGALHRVALVTDGTRNAVIGWMQSRVKDSKQRSIIARLTAIKNIMHQQNIPVNIIMQQNECTQELTRIFGE
jgi:PKHD-type hydroxylase